MRMGAPRQEMTCPGGPGLVGDDGPLGPGQGVEEGALPGVGLADDGGGDPLPHQLPPGKALGEGGELGLGLFQRLGGVSQVKGL